MVEKEKETIIALRVTTSSGVVSQHQVPKKDIGDFVNKMVETGFVRMEGEEIEIEGEEGI